MIDQRHAKEKKKAAIVEANLKNLNEAFFNDSQSQSNTVNNQTTINNKTNDIFMDDETNSTAIATRNSIKQCTQLALAQNQQQHLDLSDIDSNISKRLNLNHVNIKNNSDLDVNIITTTKTCIKITLVNDNNDNSVPINNNDQDSENVHSSLLTTDESNSNLTGAKQALTSNNTSTCDRLKIVDTQNRIVDSIKKPSQLDFSGKSTFLASDHLSLFKRRESVQSSYSDTSFNGSFESNHQFLSSLTSSPLYKRCKGKKKLMEKFNKVSDHFLQGSSSARGKNIRSTLF
jgi:hypothetical protein